MTPIHDGQDVQLDVFGNQIPVDEVLAFCTRDDDCRAEPDAHMSDCPVERRLRDEYGF